MRLALLDSMRNDKDRLDGLMQASLDVAGKAFAGEGEVVEPDFVLTGETNLMHLSHEADIEVIRQLFETFARKRDVLHLLDRCLAAGGVQLFIGAESGQQVFGDVSLVTASYQVEGRIAGVLGVLGPTRMAYQRIIPIVDVTARLLGAALDQGH